MLKQGIAAIALVVSLGLIVPGSFSGPASADISREWGVQPMAISCDFDGDKIFEYTSEVTSADHDPGGKMATLQDVNSSLVFVPQSGYVTTVYTALENRVDWPQYDDSDVEAVVPLASGDPRLAGGYPVSFVIPPGHPWSYFGDGFSIGGAKSNKKNLVDCEVNDVGKANPGTTCVANGVELVQEPDGIAVCFENVFGAGRDNAVQTDCLVGGVSQDLCFVPPIEAENEDDDLRVSYIYDDTFSIKAVVSGNGGASLQAASADNGGTLSATNAADDGKHKHKAKKGGKHRGNGKHRR
jgi:hypothetical protein